MVRKISKSRNQNIKIFQTVMVTTLLAVSLFGVLVDQVNAAFLSGHNDPAPVSTSTSNSPSPSPGTSTQDFPDASPSPAASLRPENGATSKDPSVTSTDGSNQSLDWISWMLSGIVVLVVILAGITWYKKQK